MKNPNVLLVDDNGAVLRATQLVLEANGFVVVTATAVSEALNQIVTQPFDVLITDLHMPDPGDGFAVVTAMRHAQPDALTLVISGYPNVEDAMAAILLQADEVLAKPFDAVDLIKLIRKKLKTAKSSLRAPKSSVASILERDVSITIQRWLSRVQQVEQLTAVPLSNQERMEHLPEMHKEIVSRLRKQRLMEPAASECPAAVAHGQLRHCQGYTASLLVQESRILRQCIFETIQRNLGSVDFGLVLPDVMLIADEVDSQLAQSIHSFLKLQQQAAV